MPGTKIDSNIHVNLGNSRPIPSRLEALAKYTEHKDGIETGRLERPDISEDPFEVLKPIRDGDWDALKARLDNQKDLCFRSDIPYDGSLMSIKQIIKQEAQDGLLIKFNRYDDERKKKLAKAPSLVSAQSTPVKEDAAINNLANALK